MRHFQKVPRYFWDDVAARREHLHDLEKKLRITRPEGWYDVSFQKVHEVGAGGLIQCYNKSVASMVADLHPSVCWLPWRFSKVPTQFWENPENKRSCFTWVESCLNVKIPEDWYKVTREDVQRAGGGGLLQCYNNSLSLMVISSLPDYDWNLFGFVRVPKGYWDVWNNGVHYLHKLAEKLKINEVNDWYNVFPVEIMRFHGNTLLQRHHGLFGLLRCYFPETSWDRSKFSSHLRTQKYLYASLQRLFPNYELLFNYRLKGMAVEIDIFLPELRLGFEYQGEQHFFPFLCHHSIDTQKRRDYQKRQICQQIQITLVEINYWWDRQESSLVATIRSQRPDLLVLDCLNPPLSHSGKISESQSVVCTTIYCKTC